MFDPTPLLLIPSGATTREAVVAAGPDEVVGADPDDLDERLDEASYGAVVVVHDPPAVDAVAVVERVRADDDLVPIVVTGAGDVEFVADVVAAGADRYVPLARGDGSLADAIAEAVETGDERRDRALDSEILSQILDSAPIEIYAKDRARRHVRSTKTARYDDAVGKRSTEFLDSRREATIEAEDSEVLESEEPMEEVLSRYEVDATSVDDHDAGWMQSWKYPWYDGDGSLLGLIGFTQDVTGVMGTQQELRRKNDLLSEFASVVTHDIRNPLNVAEGNLQLARQEPEEQYFDAIDRSLGRMNDIIDDLVRLTRGDESGEEASVSLAEAVHHAWETVDTASASLEVDVGEAVLRADEGPLQQLFENLFRNAVEHAGRDVTVTVGLTDSGFSVADDGPGLSDGLTAALNEGDFQSSGLGLNIVRTIADRHDWTLRAGESDAGGARFEFSNCQIVRNTGTTARDRRPAALDDATAVGEFSGGEHSVEGGTWTVTGSGRNFWRSVNEFYFVHGAVDGDADLVAHLTEFATNIGKSKAGIVVRSGLADTAAHGFVGLTPEHGTEMLWQLEEGAGTQSRTLDDDVTAPQWLRLKREGDVVTAFVSENGFEWTPVDEQELQLADRAYYGLAVCSHDESETVTAEYTDVDLAGVTWEPTGDPRGRRTRL